MERSFGGRVTGRGNWARTMFMRTKPESVQRRKFLGAGLSATAAGVLASCGRTGGGPHWRFFTAAEARTVDAICEQIIPADTDPGARQAGVVNFIDLQLTKHHKRHQAAYRKGIAGVDAVSRKRFGKPFAELPSEQQVDSDGRGEQRRRVLRLDPNPHHARLLRRPSPRRQPRRNELEDAGPAISTGAGPHACRAEGGLTRWP